MARVEHLGARIAARKVRRRIAADVEAIGRELPHPCEQRQEHAI